MSTNSQPQLMSVSVGKYYSSTPSKFFEQIQAIASETPNQTAIWFDDTSFSYQWLNSTANRLCHFLLAHGLAPGDHVAVAIDPSPYILVAILAIQKAGAVYVPIDPGYPASRIEMMVAEVEASLCLVNSSGPQYENIKPLFEKGNVGHPQRVDLSTVDLADSTLADGNPGLDVDLDSSSHIFFTSGTTGKPKAVVATHGNLDHFLKSAQHAYRFKSSDVFIAAARFTFSICFFELLVPLSIGASVRILRRETVLNMEALAENLEKVTVFHLGPSLLKKILTYIEKDSTSFTRFESLRHASSGGDHVPVQVLDALHRIFTNAEIWVIYGSTEVSCMGCTWFVPRGEKILKTLVGLPHTNTTVRVEDERGEAVSNGEVGEILICGPGVVKGYLGLPELNREKFVYRNGERFYKIGDLGCIDKHGRLELKGRKDFQVQIRGMRVELLEIEAHLKTAPGVLDCVVAGIQDGEEGELSLVAYLVAASKEALSVEVMLAQLSQVLPDFMVPSRFVWLPSLPLNDNGKLDRAQLPRPNLANLLVSTGFEAPADSTEVALLDIWEKLFQMPGIGVNHDFFELGGDSLMAVQFLMEVDAQYGKFIPIAALIEHPSIRQLAKIVRGQINVQEMQNVNVLRTGDSTLPPLFCLYGVLLYQDLAHAMTIPNMVCGVYLQEEVDLIRRGVESEEFRTFTDVQVIAQHYANSIVRYQQSGPYYLCGESFGGIIALEVAKLLEAKGEQVHLIAMFDTLAPKFLERLSLGKKMRIHLRLLQADGFGYLSSRLGLLAKKWGERIQEWLGRITQRAQPSGDALRDLVRRIASSRYSPKPSHHEILLFKATDRSAFEDGSDDLGWHQYVARVQAYEVKGSHIGILTKGNVEVIARELSQRMNTSER